MQRQRKRSKKGQQQLVESPAEIPAGNRTLKLAWLYFVSGIPALVYQTVWQRLLVLHSGVGSTSVAIIVAAYLAQHISNGAAVPRVVIDNHHHGRKRALRVHRVSHA